jgi:hypothetical protein
MYRRWGETEERPLDATYLAGLERTERSAPSVVGMVAYGDIAWVACRVLMLSSRYTHPEALYCAGQTIEKYLKALLLARGQPITETRGRREFPTHDLPLLASRLGGEFADPEFLQLCRTLQPFEIAGRYPDHDLDRWEHDLALLTFLDGFVARCRALIDPGLPALPEIVPAMFAERPGNPAMRGAQEAVADNNGLLPAPSRPR